MYTCIAYDISSNRTRLRASKSCKKTGLVRLQKSVFAGKASAAAIAELEAEIRALLAPGDKFVVIPLDKPGFLALAEQSGCAAVRRLGELFVYREL
jgi:CRISPR-associated protein Cas2